MKNRREFVKSVLAAGVAVRGSSLLAAGNRRVFYSSFMHETNTFHPVRSDSFEFSVPAPKPFAAWEGSNLAIVPGVAAHPKGGGTVGQNGCRDATDRVIAALKSAMPVDAVFLQLHGAMFAEGIGPAESELTAAVRGVVGPKVPIACTFDLHGCLPERLARSGDILVGYKTAPHIDQVETAEHAARILRETLEGRARPVSCLLPIPMMLPGEKAMTTAEPFKSLVEEARRVEREGVPGHKARILAATLFVGCAWTDSVDTGMNVTVTADGSKDAARAAAVHLARKVWEARKQFVFGCEYAGLEEGVSRALAAKESTVFLTDSGDNITASTPGDLPLVLRHLVDKGIDRAVVAGINDSAATDLCFRAGEGKKVPLSIGATIETRFGPPLKAEVQILRLIQKPRMAVVRVGKVEAVLCDGAIRFTAPEHFSICGIDPLKYKLVVVKQGYLFAALNKIAPRYIMLMTQGSGDMRLETLTYTRRRKPLFPFEPDTQFDPQ